MSSGSADKYPTLTTDELCKLDVRSIAARDSACFLWVTVPLLDEGFRVMEAWGFKYKTALFWIKTGRLGLGYWFRGNVEVLLFGIRGKVPAFHFAMRNHFEDAPRRHSQKPDRVYSILEKTHLTPRVELFARDTRKGWDSWGLDVIGDLELGFNE